MDNAVMQRALQIMERQSVLAEEYMRTKNLPFVTAFIMAGDVAGSEIWDREFESGELTFEQALILMGSYARFDWMIRKLEEGKVSAREVYSRLCSEWSGSDPDDMDYRYLTVFQNAHRANDFKMLLDGEPLPGNGLVKVYRGETALLTSPHGFAWTVDKAIACKFSKDAGLRTFFPHGYVWSGLTRRRHVLAYITGRGESEVIVDSADVYGLSVERIGG